MLENRKQKIENYQAETEQKKASTYILEKYIISIGKKLNKQEQALTYWSIKDGQCQKA